MYMLYMCIRMCLYFQGYTPVMEGTPSQLTPQVTPAHVRAENQEAHRLAAGTSPSHNSTTEVMLHSTCEYVLCHGLKKFFF